MDPFDTGTQFNFEYAPGVTIDQMVGFEIAGQFWSQHLADNVTLNIFVEITDTLPENVVGGALPGLMENQTFGDYRSQIAADADPLSVIDQGIVNGLNRYSRDSFSVLMNGYKSVSGNNEVSLTRANAKALGFTVDPLTGEVEGLDSYILISDLSNLTANQDNDPTNDIEWYYDYDNNNVPDKQLDFLSVALHEIGHALGFVSGVDDDDWLTMMNNYNGDDDEWEDDYGGGEKLTHVTPVDLLRFSNRIGGWRDEAEIWEYAVDMAIGGNPFFSVDGGRTAEAYFATGENTNKGGDGNQASHWKKNDSTPLGIMDPVLSPGTRREISDLDQDLFDAIGWNLRTVVTDLGTLETEAKETIVDKINQKKDWMKDNSDEEETLDWQNQHSEEAAQLLDSNDNTTVTVEWLESNIQAAVDMLASVFQDRNNDGIDDRGAKLNDMIVGSNQYEWGWSGYWWGWSGYWWGWSGYWQNANQSQDGFWSHFSWQTIDLAESSSSNNESSEADIAGVFDDFSLLQTGFEVAETSTNNYLSRGDRNFKSDNPSDRERRENIIAKQPDAEARITSRIDGGETIVAESTTSLSDLLGDVFPEKLEVMLGRDELLVMPIR